MGPRFIVPSDGLEKPGIKSATLVYKVSDITTAPRRLLKFILSWVNRHLYNISYE